MAVSSNQFSFEQIPQIRQKLRHFVSHMVKKIHINSVLHLIVKQSSLFRNGTRAYQRAINANEQRM